MGQVSRERPLAIQVEGLDDVSTTICSRGDPFEQGIVSAREGESPPSFHNGLETMYMASFQGRTFFDLTTRDWASHHCVSRLNQNKNTFKTCILNSHIH